MWPLLKLVPKCGLTFCGQKCTEAYITARTLGGEERSWGRGGVVRSRVKPVHRFAPHYRGFTARPWKGMPIYALGTANTLLALGSAPECFGLIEERGALRGPARGTRCTWAHKGDGVCDTIAHYQQGVPKFCQCLVQGGLHAIDLAGLLGELGVWWGRTRLPLHP